MAEFSLQRPVPFSIVFEGKPLVRGRLEQLGVALFFLNFAAHAHTGLAVELLPAVPQSFDVVGPVAEKPILLGLVVATLFDNVLSRLNLTYTYSPRPEDRPLVTNTKIPWIDVETPWERGGVGENTCAVRSLSHGSERRPTSCAYRQIGISLRLPLCE